MKIVNLTQHAASAEQTAAGVFELIDDNKAELVKLLTFETLPTKEEVIDRACRISDLAAAAKAEAAMIGGAPYLMGALETSLREQGVNPLYAFSVRRSVEKTDPATGQVTKTSVFEHLGFVQV